MDQTALRQGIDDLYAAYVDCIDDDRLEDWPAFFVDDCRYLITDRDSHAAGLRHGIIYCASRGMVEDRVMAMRRANIFEPHRYRHIVGAARLGAVESGVAAAEHLIPEKSEDRRVGKFRRAPETPVSGIDQPEERIADACEILGRQPIPRSRLREGNEMRRELLAVALKLAAALAPRRVDALEHLPE